jgi:hypothetical protein
MTSGHCEQIHNKHTHPPVLLVNQTKPATQHTSISPSPPDPYNQPSQVSEQYHHPAWLST